MDRFTEYIKLSKEELVEKVIELENRIFSNDNIVGGGSSNNFPKYGGGGGGTGLGADYEKIVIYNFGDKILR